jgi:dTMP kinase
MGYFISFEGIDFCGKSTQIQLLKNYLISQNKSTLLVREPGGTPLSEAVREMLLDKKQLHMAAETELLLMSASRVQLVSEEIERKINEYDYIITDRFFDSSTAYQGYGRGLDINFINQLNNFASKNISPKITFLIDLSVEESYKRKQLANRDLASDRIESAGKDFFTKVREGYLSIAKREPRIIVIDGMLEKEKIHQLIIEKLF